jgi:hypothetical protein
MRLMGDDVLACLFGDMYTDVEKTMNEMKRQVLVGGSEASFSTRWRDGSSPKSNA